jgi:hypothetical protein
MASYLHRLVGVKSLIVVGALLALSPVVAACGAGARTGFRDSPAIPGSSRVCPIRAPAAASARTTTLAW